MDKRLERILPRVQKPARYVGGEFNAIMKDKSKVDTRVAFCFPDTYEIGMSNLGMRILYGVMNNIEGVWCERCFAPWGDMEQEMRNANIPLYALESFDPIKDFDIIAFSIGYEMAFPAMVDMLDLAGVPLHASERTALTPLVVAGGTAMYNCEPIADFIDLALIGEGEEMDVELIELHRQARREGWSKHEFLVCAAQIPGVYVPSLYDVVYNDDGTVKSITANEGAPKVVLKRIMRDMDKAVARIQKALANDETIAVFGDYDVDGITSTVLLLDYLKNCGAKCLRYIPRRIEDGYGLSKDAIQGLRDKGVTLMITVDCGITGNEEIDFAASIGMDVVVTDHHECKENLPRAVAVVDPHRPDDTYPFKYLAGVGVALKLVLALGGPDRENALFARYCTLAAIGTIADVMRMEGENRTIVSCGLAALNHTDFVGIHALLKEAGLLGKPITSIQIGFVLSPRINAAGRMGAADLAADLLQETDPAKAEELAKQLCDLNRERQAVEQSICADAIAQIERLRPEERNALVLSSEEWHQGVVGIVASRLSEKYAAPSFMIHLKDGSGKGSCRSYGGFNLFSALESCSDLLDGFGGHELAAGFTIPEENIDTFRQRMNRFVKAASGGERAVSCLEVDAAISNPADMTLEQVDHLAQLEPYGSGNPRPVFALLGATVDSVQAVGQGKHLKLRLSKGPSRFDAIFFSMPEAAAQLEPGCRVDAAFYLQANTFRGTTTLQLQLVDLRPSLTPSRHEAESLDLLHRLTGEQPLTAQETARLMISRDQFAAFWRILDRHLKQGKLETDLLPYLRSLAAQVGGCDSFLRAALALTVFQERGLISLSRQEDRVTLCLNPIQGKVDLYASPCLRRLRGGAEVKRGDSQ